MLSHPTRISYLLPLLPLTLPLQAWVLGLAFDWPELWAWLPLVVLFGLLPLMDVWMGIDTANVTNSRLAARLDKVRFFRLIPLLCLPAFGLLLLWGGWVFANAQWHWLGQLGWLLSMGVIGGAIGITAAHELIHKPTRLEQRCGGLLLSLFCYASFKIEHIYGHHVWVATPQDPSTARFNQSLYSFLTGALKLNTRNAWRLQKARLHRQGYSTLSRHNELIGWYALTLLVLTAFWLAWGWLGALFFLGQSAVAVCLLETVNYIEHYGLRRQRLASGRYERVTPAHSWNAAFWLSNRLLFQLQRHSDHHARAARRYQLLAHHDSAPQLPAGYATLVLLALVPPLWRRVMNPRVMRFAQKQLR